MEPDGITRVYTTYGGESSNVKEVFPVDNSTEESVLGYDASSVYLRTDARCFRFGPENDRQWLVQDMNKNKDSIYKVQASGATEQGGYNELAGSLESKLGKAGLTILVIENHYL